MNDKFSEAVRKWAKKSGLAADKIAVASFIDVAGGVMMDTPIDKGWLLSNWRLAIDKVDPTLANENETSRGPAMARVQNFAPNILGHVAYCTNNTPYARKIEYEGWSKKAEQGMLNKNVNRFIDAVNRATRENKV